MKAELIPGRGFLKEYIIRKCRRGFVKIAGDRDNGSMAFGDNMSSPDPVGSRGG